MLQDFNFCMVSTDRMTGKWRKQYEELPRRNRASFTLYRGPKGELGISFEMLNAALRHAMAEQKKRGIEPVIISMPFDDFIPFDADSLHPDWDHPTESKNNIRDGWVPDVRATRQGKSTRAKFPTWGFTAHVHVPSVDEKSLEAVRILFNYAGLLFGLGAYRPSQGGPFGTFTVKEVAAETPK